MQWSRKQVPRRSPSRMKLVSRYALEPMSMGQLWSCKHGRWVVGVSTVLTIRQFVIRGTVLPSATVLKHATINAAQQLDKVGELGEIVVGAYADILLLKGNPLEDIGVLDRKEENHMCIMKDGRVVKSRVAELPVEISCEY